MKYASDLNLHCISLTDHDTTEGTDELLREAMKKNVRTLTGLEVSSTHRDLSLHILGYGIDHRETGLKEKLSQLQQGREARNQKIIGRLQKMGIDISHEELDVVSGQGQTGRPHIARLLTLKKIVPSSEDAFKFYLRRGGPAWAERITFSAGQSIAMIHQAGGIAVLAHPGQITPQPSSLSLLIGELAEMGLDGIEVFYPGYPKKVQNKLTRIAGRYKLVITGGSDYHGENKLYSRMAGGRNGFCPPDSLLDLIDEKIKISRNHN